MALLRYRMPLILLGSIVISINTMEHNTDGPLLSFIKKLNQEMASQDKLELHVVAPSFWKKKLAIERKNRSTKQPLFQDNYTFTQRSFLKTLEECKELYGNARYGTLIEHYQMTYDQIRTKINYFDIESQKIIEEVYVTKHSLCVIM